MSFLINERTNDGGDVNVLFGLGAEALDTLRARHRRRRETMLGDGGVEEDESLAPRRLGTLEVITFCRLHDVNVQRRLHYSGVSGLKSLQDRGLERFPNSGGGVMFSRASRVCLRATDVAPLKAQMGVRCSECECVLPS